MRGRLVEESCGFRVEGSVQGVGFRWWTQRKGLELGLRGAVTNRSDGSVEVRVTGSSDAVEELERCLGLGPPASRVLSVARIPSLLPIPTDGFTIEG